MTDIGLGELRRALQRSQATLAIQIGITQSAVSQLERGGDVKVSTLRTYMHGLGADLRIAAVFREGDDETVVPLQLGQSED